MIPDPMPVTVGQAWEMIKTADVVFYKTAGDTDISQIMTMRGFEGKTLMVCFWPVPGKKRWHPVKPWKYICCPRYS